MPPPRKKSMTFSIREVRIPGCKGRTSEIPLVKDRQPCQTSNVTEHPLEQQIQEVPVVHDVGMQETQSVSSWKDVAEDFISVHIEDTFMNSLCVVCTLPLAAKMHIKCSDCGTDSYFCSKECLSVVHKWNLNPLHKPIEFQLMDNNRFSYKGCFMDIQFRRPDHECGTKQERYGIQAYDHLGRPHLISVVTCKCEKECVTMYRYGFWSSSIKKPSVVFHTELLDTMEYLMLEGKMSLLSICQSLRWRNSLTSSECSTLYKQLCGEPIGHYRFFKSQIRQMATASDNSRISSCRACLNDGSIFICLDANFGLVRKKGAASSELHRMTPNHGTKMFMERQEVEADVSSSTNSSCSNFQAITTLRSRSTLNKLDVNGVFGCACRHGVPVRFLDFSHHGERFYLSVAIIDSLLDEIKGTQVKLHVIYDIGCVLDTHLKAKGEKYKDISLAVPVFHAYGHSGSCQVKYSTRWLEGYGLTDGEDMERLWSFLRRFSYVTKEMTAAHRIDLLTEALLHFSMKKNAEMDVYLNSKMDKAQNLLAVTKEELSVYHEGTSLTFAETNVIAAQYAQSMSINKSKENDLTVEETYVDLLCKQDTLRKDHLQHLDSVRHENIQEQIDRLDAEISKKERKLGIIRRWTPDNAEYQKHKVDVKRKKQHELLLTMRHHALQYQFLLSLKGKYGERNQKIATRLQKQIQKTSKNIKTTIDKYVKGKHGHISFTMASKPDDKVYQDITTNSTTVKIGDKEFAPSTQHQIALLVNTIQRATEECTLLQEEMLSLLLCISQEHLHLGVKLQTCKSMKQAIVINTYRDGIQLIYFRARGLFGRWIELPSVPEHLELTEEPTIDLTFDIASIELSSDEESCVEDEEDNDDIEFVV